MCDVNNLNYGYYWTAYILYLTSVDLISSIMVFPWYFFHLNNGHHFLFRWSLISYFIIQDVAALSLDDTEYSISVKIYKIKFSQVQETWSPAFKMYYINILEAMAVFLKLRKIKPKRGSHICLVLNSNVIINCWNRRGSWLAMINHVIIGLFLLASRLRWHLSTIHLLVIGNVILDSLLSTAPLVQEWSLEANSFFFCAKLGAKDEVDLFGGLWTTNWKKK